MRHAVAIALILSSTLLASVGRAFCGFYVAGADAKLFNRATQVVLMRDGTHTVLSMQNNYQGPPADFAMVVPVPVVLQKENVKTLDAAIFARIDQLSAPRLVEYWEIDPCWVAPRDEMSDAAPVPSAKPSEPSAVKVEAEFKVGEYDVVVLSSDDSAALDGWLRDNHYSIPAGAELLLKPYVAAGMKFFVAKVDAARVKMKDGMATLSPLRFHYEDSEFRLPVRLGLVNSNGTQDLIVHILAASRYELANYPNVTIPTNIDVSDKAKAGFGAFYAALFDRTLEKNPGAVVTEYAWDSRGCDPCPAPPLGEQEIVTLGGDVIESLRNGGVLTRLHARYAKDALGEDLVFRRADPIVGGRESWRDGELETGATKSTDNAFQGRYAIRHPWRGRMACANAQRRRWGGPPENQNDKPRPTPALDLAFAPRGGEKLLSFLAQDVKELGLEREKPERGSASAPPRPSGSEAPGGKSCNCTMAAPQPLSPLMLLAAALASCALRRGRRANGPSAAARSIPARRSSADRRGRSRPST